MNESMQPNIPTMILVILVLTALISSSTSAAAMNEEILTATQEMQNANYFTFVMLLNMAPPNTFQGNITFLMPNDRRLANATIPGATVLDFLLRHSIPSPLLVDHLEHFPTGSTIPASKPGFVFEVTNKGRRRFFLSNARITSPNICTRGTSIRCHGIDGVVEPTMLPQPNYMPPTPACAAAPVAPPPETGHVPAVIAAPPPPSTVKQVSRQKSSSCRSTVVDLLTVLAVVILGFIYLLF